MVNAKIILILVFLSLIPGASAVCSGTASGGTITAGDCNNLTALNAAISDTSLLNNEGGGVWFLNANLSIDLGTIFYLNDTDLTWLKINATGKISSAAYWIKVLGTLNGSSVKITSWNSTASSTENLRNIQYDLNFGRPYIYNSGGSSHIYINNSNITGLGGHCSGMTGGASLCNGITITGSSGNYIKNTVLNDNYVVYIQQSASNTEISGNTINSKYGSLWIKSDSQNVFNNTITYAAQSSLGSSLYAFSGISITSSYNIISGNTISQTGTGDNGGIYLANPAGYNRILNNRVTSNGFSALYFTGSGGSVSNNHIQDSYFAKPSPITADQAPVQNEFGILDNNTYDNVTIESYLSVRAMVMRSTNGTINNSFIHNYKSGCESGLQFFVGDNLKIRNTSITTTGCRAIEHDADNGTLYIYDVFPESFGIDVSTAILEMATVNSNPFKYATSNSNHFPTYSGLRFIGNQNFSNGNIVQYPQFQIYGTNSTVSSVTASGFSVTNNVGNVTEVIFKTISPGVNYALKMNGVDVKTVTADATKADFAGLSLSDGSYTVSSRNLSFSNPVIVPLTPVASQPVEIGINIACSDGCVPSTVGVNILRPGSAALNYTMSGSAGIYSYSYTNTGAVGEYTVNYFYAIDGGGFLYVYPSGVTFTVSGNPGGGATPTPTPGGGGTGGGPTTIPTSVPVENMTISSNAENPIGPETNTAMLEGLMAVGGIMTVVGARKNVKNITFALGLFFLFGSAYFLGYVGW